MWVGNLRSLLIGERIDLHVKQNKNVRHIDFRGNINTGSIAFGGLSDRGSETVKEVWL